MLKRFAIRLLLFLALVAVHFIVSVAAFIFAYACCMSLGGQDVGYGILWFFFFPQILQLLITGEGQLLSDWPGTLWNSTVWVASAYVLWFTTLQSCRTLLRVSRVHRPG